MENAAKALEMAAGVLLGVLMFTLVAYLFASIGSRPKDEDMSLSAEQLAKFNLEYEVYNKQAMYGVDVISCLNKAKSNNEKYVSGEGFLTGQAYGDKYSIDVKLQINTKLTESLIVNHIVNGKEVEIYNYSEVPSEKLGAIPTLEDAGFVFFEKGKKATDLKKDYLLITNEVSERKNHEVKDLLDIKKEYSLLKHSTEIGSILEYSQGNNMSQVVYNRTGENTDVWSSAVWRTALYNLKQKRFKCNGITYNSETGRVKEINFVEID